MNELAKHNYRGQELIALWLMPARSKQKSKLIPRSIKSEWKIPEPLCGPNCPECGEKIEPIALDTGARAGFLVGNAQADYANCLQM